MKKLKPYAELAEYYDPLYTWKDYKGEAKTIKKLILKHKKTKGKDLLEVACGTGKHLVYLKKDFKCIGIDLNGEMLKIARKRVKGVTFKKGNMINFNLKKKYDVITCLFSSIGYVKTYSNLNKTIRNFSKHLKTGGVVIIEPWLTPKAWKTGSLHMRCSDGKDRKIARIVVSGKNGNKSIMNMHHLIADKGGVVYFIEKHEMGLFTVKKTLEIMRKAGFKAKFLSAGPMKGKGRGVFVGVKE